MDNEERKPDFVVGIFVDPTDDNNLSYFKKHGISEDEINDAVASAISELDLFEEADVSAYLLPNPVDSSLGDRSGAEREPRCKCGHYFLDHGKVDIGAHDGKCDSCSCLKWRPKFSRTVTPGSAERSL